MNPLSVQIPLEHIDRLLDVAYLAGVTPNEESLQCIWQSLRKHQLVDVDTFLENLGPLGVSLEMKVSSKHEIEWREGQYTDKTSVVLSTKHHEGSELGTLRNENEGHPGLDGLILEIVASEDPLVPLVANISWDDDALKGGAPGIRWDFLRTLHASIKFHEDLPEQLPVAPGHRENFHFVHVELGTAVIRADRVAQQQKTESSSTPEPSKAEQSPHDTHGGVILTNPPPEVLAKLLELTDALQLQSPWTTRRTRLDIVNHMLEVLSRPQKLNVDTLMMCEGAHPCLIFSLDETSNGESFPAKRGTSVSMLDYTCGTGDFALCLTRDSAGMTANCRWTRRNSRFNEIPWKDISTLVKPYSRR